MCWFGELLPSYVRNVDGLNFGGYGTESHSFLYSEYSSKFKTNILPEICLRLAALKSYEGTD